MVFKTEFRNRLMRRWQLIRHEGRERASHVGIRARKMEALGTANAKAPSWECADLSIHRTIRRLV